MELELDLKEVYDAEQLRGGGDVSALALSEDNVHPAQGKASGLNKLLFRLPFSKLKYFFCVRGQRLKCDFPICRVEI